MVDVDIEELGTLGGEEDVRAGRLLQAHVQRVGRATLDACVPSNETEGGGGADSGTSSHSGACAATDSFLPGTQRIWVKTFGCRWVIRLLACRVGMPAIGLAPNEKRDLI